MPGIPRVYMRADQQTYGQESDMYKQIETAIDEERDQRLKMIQKARKYYDGDHDRPLVVAPHEKDDNIILNLAGQTVDKTADFIGVPVLNTAEENDDGVEEVLQKLVRLNELEFLIPDMLISGQIAGHAFVKIILPEMGEISEDNPPMIGLLHPEYVTVCWDMGLYGMRQSALWYRLEWEFGKMKTRQDIVPANLVPNDDGTINENAEGWLILEYRQGGQTQTNRGWELIAVDEWLYPFAPIADCKNDRNPHKYYGRSDLRHLDLNDAVNFIASNTGKIIKHHAHPNTVIFSESEPPKATEVGGLWHIFDTEGKVQNVEMDSDLSSSMDFLNMLRSSWFTESRVVDMTTQKDKVGQMTNFGVRMLFNDQIEMCAFKKSSYGKMIQMVFGRMLTMLGYPMAEVIAHWGDPLPMNRLEVVQTAEAEQQMGVSKTTTFKDLDRDYEAEQELVATESQNSADNRVSSMMRIAQGGGL